MPATRHVLDAPPWQGMASNLLTTSKLLRRAYDARLAALGLKFSEAVVLAYVHDRGSLTQTQLADRVGMGRAAAGVLIDTLQRRGLVERRPDPADRRVWLVATTDGAVGVVEQIGAVDAALRDDLRAGITMAERKQLTEILSRLQANLSSVLAGDNGSTRKE